MPRCPLPVGRLKPALLKPGRLYSARLLRPGRVRPGAVLSVAALAIIAAGVGTWTARWDSVGKSDSVALSPAAGVVTKMVEYTEAGAYSIRVPAGWQIVRQDGVMEWDDRTSGRGLRISPAQGEPLSGLRADEHRAASEHLYPGYRRLRLESVPGLGADAAEWEFTWNGEHGGEHVLCSRAAGYEFCFYAPEAQWTPGRRLYERILATFAPQRD
jgi:hypothetical protein